MRSNLFLATPRSEGGFTSTKISPCYAKRQLFVIVFGIFKPPDTGFSRFHINFLLFPSNQ